MMALTSVVAAVADEGPDRGVRRRRRRRRPAARPRARRHQRRPRRRSPASRTSSSRWRCPSSGPAARCSCSRRPAAASAKWLKDLVIGSLGNEWIPKAAVVLIVVVAVIWIPIRRSRLGLSLYAIGSNRLAAFRSGVSGRPDEDRRLHADRPVRRARRPEPDGQHRHRHAGPGPVHAAERRGGRPRRRQPRRWSGRRLRADRRGHDPPAHPDRHDVPQRQHEPRRRRPGRHPHRRGHGRQPDPDPAGARMSGDRARVRRRARGRPTREAGAACSATGRSSRCSSCSRSWSCCRELVRPGIVSAGLGRRRSLRAAVPLAILAGCQTLDDADRRHRPVGRRGRVDDRVRRRDAGRRPGARRRPSRSRSSSRRSAGLVTGVGVGVFRVHPLIMTLGMSLVVLGLANVWQLVDGPDRRRRAAPSLRTLGSGRRSSTSSRTAWSSSCPLAALRSCSRCAGPATAGCSTRSATTRSPRACPAPGRGRS